MPAPPDADFDAASASETFSSQAIMLVRAIALGEPEDELLRRLMRMLADRARNARIAVHFRDTESGEWRLAGHVGLSNDDTAALAALISAPEPLIGVSDWSRWEPIVHPRAPWRGLSSGVDGPSIVAPAMFTTGTIIGCITVFGDTSVENRAMVSYAAPLLWLIRGRGRIQMVLGAYEARYAALAEWSPDSIWRLDAGHRFAYINRTYERVVGTTASSLIGRYVLDGLPPSAHDAWCSALSRVDAPGRTSEVRYAHNGRHFSARLAPEVNVEDRVIGVVATIRDVTDRFRWATQLEAAVTRAKVVSELTRSVVYDRRLADETAYVSPSMKSVFGYEPEQFSRGGLSWWIDRIHPEDRTKFAAMFAAHENRGSTQWSIEYRVTRADGSWATVLDQGRLIVANDAESARCIGAVTDITAIRALQSQLQHAHRVELIGRLAGGVAHDFNNVLSAIGGFNELLLHSTPATDERTADLLEISALVKRASALTQNLLGLSRRRDQSTPTVIELSTAVLRLAPTLRTLLGSGVTLAIESIGEGLTTRIDPGHLDQIILNLAVNARDAMPDGGTVTINARLSDAGDGHAATPAVLLEVSDCGLGISREVIEKIFQPFFTTKAEGHGTGLGLSVVHDIVHAQGGTISVTSTPNVGTTFTVRLPLAQSAVSTEIEDATTAEMPASGGTVLLVEDEEAVRRSTKRILEREGFAVIEARTGDAGLAALLAHRATIDVVVTDLYMPGLSGPALVERMRAEAPEIGCVVISGHAERFAKLTPSEGELIVVTKPCRGAKLVEHIAALAKATRARRAIPKSH